MRSFSGEHRVTRNVGADRGDRNPSGLSLLISPEGEAIVNQPPHQSGKVPGTVPTRTVCLSTVDAEGFISDEWMDL